MIKTKTPFDAVLLAATTDFSATGLPNPALIIMLENWDYMASLKEKT